MRPCKFHPKRKRRNCNNFRETWKKLRPPPSSTSLLSRAPVWTQTMKMIHKERHPEITSFRSIIHGRDRGLKWRQSGRCCRIFKLWRKDRIPWYASWRHNLRTALSSLKGIKGRETRKEQGWLIGESRLRRSCLHTRTGRFLLCLWEVWGEVL